MKVQILPAVFLASSDSTHTQAGIHGEKMKKIKFNRECIPIGIEDVPTGVSFILLTAVYLGTLYKEDHVYLNKEWRIIPSGMMCLSEVSLSIIGVPEKYIRRRFTGSLCKVLRHKQQLKRTNAAC